ncbi:MAG: type III-B CRISPR module RAMP protein Cmr4 [Melioribacteraceae bacterium]|nr:type III-B CRISPR module RAMP protein Cmr4 [Melioribacteraceae bacterium]
MFKLAKPFMFRTISSLHAGSGNDLGIVDLPIQREKHTSFPKVESSSLKGALRESFETNEKTKKEEFIKNILNISTQNETKELILNYDYSIHLAFGYDESGTQDEIIKKFDDDKEFSGALGFSDARLLFFPVRSAKGVFAWITCPYVLKRFVEDMNLCGQKINLTIPDVTIGKCLTFSDNKVSIDKKAVVLEEYTFEEKQELKFDILYSLSSELKEKLVVLSDDDFKDFVNQSTEVITRTKIDNATGTVAIGALFNEEYLPPETIMYFIVFASPVFQKDDNKKGIFKKNGKNEEELVMEFFEKSLPEVVQIGGNATIGKGIVKMMKINFNEKKNGGK